MIVLNEFSLIKRFRKRLKRPSFIIVFFLFFYILFLFYTKFTDFKFDLNVTRNRENIITMRDIILQRIEKNEWVVQYKIAQYSSIIAEQLDGTVDIEALFFHDNATKLDYIRQNVKCLPVKSEYEFLERGLYSEFLNPFEVLQIDAIGSIWLIKCKKKDVSTIDNDDHIAIIDLNNFQESQNWNHKNNSQKIILKAQKPGVFKR